MEAAGARTRAAARRRGRRLRGPATLKEQRDPQPGGRLLQRRIEEDQEEAVFREVVSFTPDPLPVRYYDKDTTKPISFYLSSLEELLAWTPNMEDGFNVALGPPECRQPPLSSRRPRTLMCHDMMGGYLDDKFIQGSATQNPYSFYHWQYIDIFVYFSHHTVTIPPVGWTNAAHRHGVCVLGTFITEWKEGERLCEAFLAGDERSYQAVARQLVLIAQFFRFDGWLINIENSLSVSTPAPGAWPAGPCAPRGPSIALLGLIRPVPATAALPPSQLEPAPTPLPLHREMDVLHRGVQKPCALSFASLAPSRRPLLCSRRMCGFLHAAFPFHCVLSFPDCCVHVLPASERTESRTSGWTLCSTAVGLRGFRDQDPFAPGVKCPPVCPVPGASHDRPLWASRKVCLLPCLQLAAVGNVPHFLRYLTTQLHQQVPRGLVLWYDSVVSSGQLTWQDELNEHNRVFFDSCDGFFTNYNWREEHLERMLGQAGERLADVYVGVDVFARGNVVGGRFHTDKSLELIRKHGFSVALFAPGWVYECLEKGDFFQNQDKFWSLLERYLPTHSICSLPFVTSFCLGMGTRRVCYGQEEAVGPWYHLSAQEIQPLFGEHRLEGDGRGWVKMHCCLEDAWNGGSSLLIRGLIPPEVGNVSVRLFSLQVPVPPKVFLSMVYKLEGPSAVGVALELTTGDAGSCHVGGISALSETSSRRSPRPLRVPPTKLAKWVGRCGQQLSGGWVQRCYEVNLRGCLLQALFVNFSRPPGSQEEENFVCRLGEIQVVDANSLLTPLPQVQAVTVSQVRWQPAASEGESGPAGLRLSCTLHWAYLLPHVRCFRIHCCRGSGGDSPCRGPSEPEKPTLLGLAFVNRYRIVDLAVAPAEPGRDGRVEFLVEPIPKEGFLVPRAEWGRAAMLYSTPRT
ncbi:cytosolic endo-beta-N-acetylglucosaminidase isoform X2 [Tursiops truncatus]|uniref:mannosyl-glycoprotein endo-beta-N-acetylglucosaminidase n=1 Tax=Tursiops truncatus TaxID=9739 RepID=A0A6J3QLD8_TURTR|nr:cytosolic endo-beta-N-acetylglucosaminidase isoform X2 [Tursiops truncatus]